MSTDDGSTDDGSTDDGSTDDGEPGDGPVATRIVLSFPADIGNHGRDRLRQDYYKKWLRKTHDTASVGEAWDEFTDVGCCGSQMDLPLRVEVVEGGDRIGPDTDVEYEEREACGVNPGWSVQNDEPHLTEGD